MMPRRWPRPHGVERVQRAHAEAELVVDPGAAQGVGRAVLDGHLGQPVERRDRRRSAGRGRRGRGRAARRRRGSGAGRRCGGPCRRRAARWWRTSGRQTRPAGPLAATSARTGVGPATSTRSPTAARQAGDEHVQAEQLGDAAELERAHGLEGALAEDGGQGAHREHLPEPRSIAVSMRRSSTCAVGLDHGVGRGERRVGDDDDAVVGEVGGGGVAGRRRGCRRTRDVACGRAARRARGVRRRRRGPRRAASSRPTSSRVSSKASSDACSSTRADSSVRVSSSRAAACSSAVDGGAVLGLAAGLGGGAALRGLLGGQAGGLVGLAAALGPAHGVALRAGGGAGALGERGRGSAR